MAHLCIKVDDERRGAIRSAAEQAGLTMTDWVNGAISRALAGQAMVGASDIARQVEAAAEANARARPSGSTRRRRTCRSSGATWAGATRRASHRSCCNPGTSRDARAHGRRGRPRRLRLGNVHGGRTGCSGAARAPCGAIRRPAT